ncbi:glycosyl transferase family 4 [Candidatus Pacearchaeota archaeon]|nr:glycosyl transferase family 4 [Candidatus Pacearchaeota archaeon]
MNPLLLIPLVVSFFTVLLLIPSWIRKAQQIGLLWDDMNKLKAPKVAGSGGLIVIMAFIISILFYIAYRVFFLQTSAFLIEILALLAVVLVLAGIGLVDDLFGWRKGGLSMRSRLILVAFASVPLMAINAGKSIISLPLIGQVDVGIFYPLIFIPIGILGASTTFNFLAGFNGLEAGQGVLILAGAAAVAWMTGNTWIAFIALCMVAALIAFLLFNKYPARVFPGDVLTYPIGGLIAILSILGNFEKIAVFFFIPVILEVLLKLRGKLVKQSFGKPLKDGTLDLKYDKIYGLEHLVIYIYRRSGIAPTERTVVITIWIAQLLIILLGFILFRQGLVM